MLSGKNYSDDILVSVLMTCYNREKYISTAIESVLASSYKNFELIITDDGSTDESIGIIKSYQLKDSRIQLYINEKNLGDYKNRNKAASHANGKYLKYVDSDDFIYPWGIELLVQMMEDFPEAGWGLCTLPQNTERPFPFLLSSKEAYEYHYFGPGLFHRAPLSSIIKKVAFDAVGGFDDIRMAGDFNMWHKLGMQYPVLLMPQGIIWYREHSEQEMNNYSNFTKVYEDIKYKYLFSENCPLNNHQLRKIIKKTKMVTRKNIIKGLVSGNINAIKESMIIYREACRHY